MDCKDPVKGLRISNNVHLASRKEELSSNRDCKCATDDKSGERKKGVQKSYVGVVG